MSLSRVALVATAAALTLVGCGSTDAEPSASAEEPAATNVMIHLATGSGHVAANHDDEHCVWGQTSYTLRDEGGEIIATGDAESDTPGEAEAGGEDAPLGEVHSTDPYECHLRFTVQDVPQAEFYELEVSASAPRSEEVFAAEVSFDAAEVEAGYVDVEVVG